MLRSSSAISVVACALLCLSACVSCSASGHNASLPRTSTIAETAEPSYAAPGGLVPSCGEAAGTQAWAEDVSGAGAVLWRTALSAEAPERAATGTGVQPVLLSKIAAFADNGLLFGMRLQDGKVIWEAVMPEQSVVVSMWGESSSVTVLTSQNSGQETLESLDAATGDKRWEVTLSQGTQSYAEGTSGLTGENELATVTPTGELLAVSLTTGHILWTVPDAESSPAEFGSVVVAEDSGRIVGYNAATGKVAWATPATGLPDPPLLQALDGLVVVTDASSGSGTSTVATALSPTDGHVVWRFDPGVLPSAESAGPAGIGFVTSTPNQLYLVDAQTGNADWHAQTSSSAITGLLITSTDMYYTQNSSSSAYLIDRKTGAGSIRWQFGPLYGSTSPATLLNGDSALISSEAETGVTGYLSAVDLTTGKTDWQVTLPAPAAGAAPLATAAGILVEPSIAYVPCPTPSSNG